VQDLDKFASFMRVCAAHVGNPINLSTIGTAIEADARGVIFENMIVADHYKRVFNRGGFPGDAAYFWRDASDREKEVDLLIEGSDEIDLYAIKFGMTAKGEFADNLFRFEKAAQGVKCVKHVVYDGPHSFTRNGVEWMNRRDFTD
jgi:predicted AAA+ superfamily ATPase